MTTFKNWLFLLWFFFKDFKSSDLNKTFLKRLNDLKICRLDNFNKTFDFWIFRMFVVCWSRLKNFLKTFLRNSISSLFNDVASTTFNDIYKASRFKVSRKISIFFSSAFFIVNFEKIIFEIEKIDRFCIIMYFCESIWEINTWNLNDDDK